MRHIATRSPIFLISPHAPSVPIMKPAETRT